LLVNRVVSGTRFVLLYFLAVYAFATHAGRRLNLGLSKHLERKDQQLRNQIQALNKVNIDNLKLQESLERVKVEIERDKRAAEASIADVNEEMSSVERKAEKWVRTAYNLTSDALPPGYRARCGS